MSNPGVIKLASLSETVENFPYRFEIEDNIGEAIHIHFKEMRLDLTVEEFISLAVTIEKTINNLVNVSGFACKKFDKVNLVGLAQLLPDLEAITEEKIKLKDLLVDTESDDGQIVICTLQNSRIVKALRGDSKENNRREQVNYYHDKRLTPSTNSERLVYNLDTIRKYGYPYNEERIVLFNDSNVIRDGGHRAGVLFYLHGGDYEVPVRRLWFKNGMYSENISAGEKTINLKDQVEFHVKGNEVEIDIHALLNVKNSGDIVAILERD